MKPTEKMEKLIKTKRPRITTDTEMDTRLLHNSFAAMEETIQAKSADYKPNLWSIIIRSRITKLAAAAVIVLVVGLFVARRIPDEQMDKPTRPEVAESPGEMMTAMSLNIAYRKGGMEEVEKQCDKAFEMLGPRPGSITVQEILAEFNGT